MLEVTEQNLPLRQMSPFRKRETSYVPFLIIEKHCQPGSFWDTVCVNDRYSY